jgi:hypothetical protein
VFLNTLNACTTKPSNAVDIVAKIVPRLWSTSLSVFHDMTGKIISNRGKIKV